MDAAGFLALIATTGPAALTATRYSLANTAAAGRGPRDAGAATSTA